MSELPRVLGSRLLDLIKATGRTDAASSTATSLLERHLDHTFESSPVRTAELREIYQRRLSRPGVTTDLVLGADRLLEALDDHEGSELALVSVADGGAVVGVWLSTDLDRVVGVTVGRDRRADRRSDGSAVGLFS